MLLLELCEICQRYNFESYSQHQAGDAFSCARCVRYVKDTILRAIHNDSALHRIYLQLCEICQRYNLESYSQLGNILCRITNCCVRYVKDTILRAIHNLEIH